MRLFLVKGTSILFLIIIIGCSSEEEIATPAVIMPELSRESNFPTQTKPVPAEPLPLTKEEEKAIDKKLENLKKSPIGKLIENYNTAKTKYESDNSFHAIRNVLEEKLLKLLKKEFPDSKDVLGFEIYNTDGKEKFMDLRLQDLFMIYFAQNPDTGVKINSKHLKLTRNKKENTVSLYMKPPGIHESQEAFFKIFKEKLVLSEYRVGRQLNPNGYQYVVGEIFKQISCEPHGFIPQLDYINQELVDSIR